ncbi:MAG: transposase [Thermoproteota archaeon]
MKSYKFRLYPTEQQVKILNDTLETCRHLYNDCLGERSADWDVGFYEQKQLLTLRKQGNKFLQQVHSQVLQDVLLRLDKAYQAFFKKIAKYPKFKRYGKYNSFTYPQSGWKIKDDGTLILSMIGAIKIELHREIIGRQKRCTIIRDIDQWYCVVITTTESEPETKPQRDTAVGIDGGLGLNWLTLSTGEKIENNLCFKEQERQIKELQRSLSRKKKGSRNREKARVALAKGWRTVRRQREDFCHKVSKHLADEFHTIVFEELNINNMVKNHKVAKAIMGATWSKLRQYTTYKVHSRGGQVILVNPNGTSQKCSRCGKVVPKDLSVRIHECQHCGLVLDRDHNAALNILKLGLEQARAEPKPLFVRQRISKFQARKQEAHVLRRG